MLKFLFCELIWRGGYGFFGLGLNSALFFWLLVQYLIHRNYGWGFQLLYQCKSLAGVPWFEVLAGATGFVFLNEYCVFRKDFWVVPGISPLWLSYCLRAQRKKWSQARKKASFDHGIRKAFRTSLETKLDVTWCKMVYSGYKTNKY